MFRFIHPVKFWRDFLCGGQLNLLLTRSLYTPCRQPYKLVYSEGQDKCSKSFHPFAYLYFVIIPSSTWCVAWLINELEKVLFLVGILSHNRIPFPNQYNLWKHLHYSHNPRKRKSIIRNRRIQRNGKTNQLRKAVDLFYTNSHSVRNGNYHIWRDRRL